VNHDEMEELRRLGARIDSMKADTSRSIRAVHERIDGLYRELGQIPAQIIAAILPQLRRANSNGKILPAKEWHESVPWKWAIGGVVFLGVLTLIKLGLDPENLRQVVTILKGEAP